MITEPSTLITDLLLAALAGGLAARLWKRASSHDRAAKLWAAGLGSIALAAAAGGFFHGFRLLLGQVAATGLWKLAVLSIGAADLLLLAGALVAWVPPRVRRALLTVLSLKFLLYAGWMTFHDAFLYVILEYAPSLVLLGALALWSISRRSARGGAQIILGVVISIAAAVILATGLSMHRHLNHNDLYHLVQMAAVWSFYRGGAAWIGTSAGTAAETP